MRFSSTHRVLKIGIWWLLLPIIFFLCGELVIRFFAPDDLLLQTTSRELFNQRNGKFPYVNMANFEGFVRERSVTIGAVGFRPKKNFRDTGKPKILLLGDSVFFGIGLADEESLSPLLEKELLNEIEVLNSSVIGYSTAHERAFLEEFGDSLAPQVVILGYCLNDGLPKTIKPIQKDEIGIMNTINKYLQGKLKSYVWLKGIMGIEQLRHSYTDTFLPFFIDNWQENKSELEKIAFWCKARSIPLILAYIPHRDQLESLENIPQKTIKEFITHANGSFLDLSERLEKADFLFGDPLHLDKRGMKKVSQHIAHYVHTKKILPQGAHSKPVNS